MTENQAPEVTDAADEFQKDIVEAEEKNKYGMATNPKPKEKTVEDTGLTNRQKGIVKKAVKDYLEAEEQMVKALDKVKEITGVKEFNAIEILKIVI